MYQLINKVFVVIENRTTKNQAPLLNYPRREDLQRRQTFDRRSMTITTPTTHIASYKMIR